MITIPETFLRSTLWTGLAMKSQHDTGDQTCQHTKHEICLADLCPLPGLTSPIDGVTTDSTFSFGVYFGELLSFNDSLRSTVDIQVLADLL